MHLIMLAAGYATRLYPLTRNRPKALLPVDGRPILDHLADWADGRPEIDRISLVTNERFAVHFEEWAGGRHCDTPLVVFNDGTLNNDDRLGALGDLRFVMERVPDAAGDFVYAMGTDHVPKFDPGGIIDLCREKGASAVFAYRPEDTGQLRRMGVPQLAEDGRIVDFEEKPQEPKGTLAVPPFYLYSPQAAALLDEYLAEGNNPDAPGHYLGWLVHRQPVYACLCEHGTYDIGTLENYRRICRQFGDEVPGL